MDGYESDTSMESSNNNSSDGESITSEFDIWSRVNNKLNAEKLSGEARIKRSLVRVLDFMKYDEAWCHNSIYKAIMTTLKEERFRERMSF